MRARDLERFLVDLTCSHTADESDVSVESSMPLTSTLLDHTTRTLRGTNFLPTGGRGLSAPHIEPRHAAAVIVGLAAAQPSWAAKTAQTMMYLRSVEDGDFETFGEALTAILSNTQNSLQMNSVVICRGRALAWIEHLDGGRTVFGESDPHRGVGEIRTEVRFGGEILLKIAQALQQR